MKHYFIFIALIFTTLTSCTTNFSGQKKHFDHLEGFNRSMYNFNTNLLDLHLIRPIAVIWLNYIPQSIRDGINNFTTNLEEPASMVNYFLQGNPYQGMVHFTRFFLNSLFGMGGFIDVAVLSDQKLQKEPPRRFGSTLGYYNIGYGPYIYLPFYGSFTLREDGAKMLDTFYPVLSLLTLPLFLAKWALEGIENRAQLLIYDEFVYHSLDPYTTIREAYFQYHNFITNGAQLKYRENPNLKAIEKKLSEID